MSVVMMQKLSTMEFDMLLQNSAKVRKKGTKISIHVCSKNRLQGNLVYAAWCHCQDRTFSSFLFFDCSVAVLSTVLISEALLLHHLS